ncbi:MAG TPA: DUF5985 family protein [Gemmatimonadaceae bacterium]|jgi:hypothetical protein|nr:DUF5985 family protein [Gemmatimonadaceae bacterium]HEU5173926.1 DUF5985 family protein [Gemmatimonadaceae bacterium]
MTPDLRATLLIAASGALTLAYAIIALFFFKFRSRTGDRLFALFALAFLILSGQRLVLTVAREWGESSVWLYSLRLLAFLVIAYAIVDKNRQRPRPVSVE